MIDDLPNFGPSSTTLAQLSGGCFVFAVVEYSTHGTPADACSAAVL